MKSRRHIVFFTPGFPANEQENTCLPTVQNFIRCFDMRFSGWDITVLSLHYPFKDETYPWNGLKIIALGGRNRSYPWRFLLWRKALKTFAKIHKEHSIDMIHSFWMHECGMLGNIFARKNQIPQVITLMGQDLRPPNYFVRWVNQDYVSLVALSDFQPERDYTGIRQPDEVIPFGLPEYEKKWFREEAKIIDVIGIGSLIRLKNYELFLEVIALLKREKPDMKVLIIGEGIDRPVIEGTIRKSGLSENVTLAGKLPREEVYTRLARSRVLLHTSSYETQGYIFNEALLADVPVVSTPVGIARQTGFWRLGTDAESLARNVRYFWNNPVEIPERAKWKMEDTVQAYEALYSRSFKSSATREATKK